MSFKDIKLTNKLYEGGHGSIYEVDDNIVCKVYVKPKSYIMDLFLREVSTINLLSNKKYIIRSLGFEINNEKGKVYLPRYKQNLADFIHYNEKSFRLQHIKRLTFQLLQGLYNANSLAIWHRDIKPWNILLDNNYNIIICDWGLSKFVDSPSKDIMSNYVQTTYYRAPEVDNLLNYNRTIDIWSVGIVMIELYNGIAYDEHEIQNLFANDYEELKKIIPNDDGIDLIKKMLMKDSSKRITVVEALNHKYFESEKTANFKELNLINNLIASYKHEIDSECFKHQPYITEETRKILFEWLYELYKNDNPNYIGVLFLTYHYIDLYLAKQNIKKQDFQKLGIVCYLIAMQMKVTSNFTKYSINRYTFGYLTIAKIVEFINHVVDILNYDLYRSTEHTFLELFAQEYNLKDNIVDKLSEELITFALDYNTRKYKPYIFVLNLLHKNKFINKSEVQKYGKLIPEMQ